MTAACDLLEAELALDHLEAALAAELPAHLRAFAVAHAAAAPPPPAPPATRRIAPVVHALAHPLLADRALALARLLIPIAIDGDPRVAAARTAPPAWDALERLAAARDAAARDRFGLPFVALMHRLAGAEVAVAAEAALPPPVPGWHAPLARTPSADVQAWWHALAARHGARATVEIVRARDGVRARTFVVEPRRHAIVVVPPIATPAARFGVWHELGHALAALLGPAGLPRAVDEAVAAYVARELETTDPLAAAARARRLALARALDAIERALPGGAVRPTAHPPWALWHDPGAQGAYVAAEALADRWCEELGAAPPAGALAAAIAHERARIDASTSLGQ